jgi:hypothetical protein
LALQEKILYELEGRINKWSDKQIIGDIFVANADALKLYVAYVNNYDNALITIRTHSKENPKFKEFLKESIAREAGDAQDIHSLLITVVQRPPRYCLLLKELLKNTPESHKDRRNVAAALEAVEKAAEYINAQKMIAEGHERSLKIKSMFQNKIAFVSTTGATIVYEGEIKAHKRGKLFVVVFDNYFLVGEEKTGLLGRKKSKFEPLVWIPLSQVKLTPASETSLTLNFGDTDAAPSPKSRTSSVAVAPAASSSGTSSATMASSSSSPSLTVTASSSSASQPAPTFILTTTTLLFNWENHETLQAWMASVLEAQTKLSKPKEDGRSRGSSIFSWLKW